MAEEATELAGFEPDGARGCAVYRRVVDRLATSVGKIVAAFPGIRNAEPRLDSLSARLAASQRPSPLVFCAYFDLFDAVRRGDAEAAAGLLGEIDRLLSQPAGEFLKDWSGLDEEARNRYLRAVNADPSTRVAFAEPDAATAQAARDSACEALAILDEVAPGLSAEVRALLGEIVFVAGTAGQGMLFDGATSFFAWGSLFLNAGEHRSRVDMIDGLAHESGHALLYGLSLGDPFVTNPPEERYRSPLRRDPRPLDGIFHATYVSARMHWAHERVLAAGILPAEEAGAAEEHRKVGMAAFRDGLRTLEAHASLTPLGRAVMEAARRYMDGAKRVPTGIVA